MRHAYLDEHSRINGLLQHLDPRIKILTFFTCLLFIILTPAAKLGIFLWYAILVAILFLISRIPALFIFTRSLTVIPFVLMVVFFLPFMRQTSVSRIAIFHSVLLKAYLSVLCLIILTASTPFSDFLKALERLGVHPLIAMILSFMYRYFFLVQDEFMQMQQARLARGGKSSGWRSLRSSANIVGVLFLRSYEKAEAVYLAMCARGFDGKVRSLNNFRIGAKEILFSALFLTTLLAIRILGA